MCHIFITTLFWFSCGLIINTCWINVVYIMVLLLLYIISLCPNATWDRMLWQSPYICLLCTVVYFKYLYYMIIWISENLILISLQFQSSYLLCTLYSLFYKSSNLQPHPYSIWDFPVPCIFVVLILFRPSSNSSRQNRRLYSLNVFSYIP